jgi:hypothetical protein
VEDSCEHGYEHSGIRKNGCEFLDWLSGYWRLNKDCAPWSSLTVVNMFMQ